MSIPYSKLPLFLSIVLSIVLLFMVLFPQHWSGKRWNNLSVSTSPSSFLSCISNATTFESSNACWSNEKKRNIVDILKQLRTIKLKQFSTTESTLPSFLVHSLFYPTIDCDFVHLQRIGNDAFEPSYQHGSGHPDGGKWFCPEHLLSDNQGPLTIFSVGSSGDFSFEESVHRYLSNAPHKLFTFDCSGNWTNPMTEFHPWCISNITSVIDGRQYFNFSDMLAKLNLTKVDLLKIDVEGYEFNFFDTLKSSVRKHLPKQILVETHFATNFPNQQFKEKEGNFLPIVIDFYTSLMDLGYQIAIREKNIYSACCAEYVLIRDF